MNTVKPAQMLEPMREQAAKTGLVGSCQTISACVGITCLLACLSFQRNPRIYVQAAGQHPAIFGSALDACTDCSWYDGRAGVSLRKTHTLYELDSYVGDFCNLLKVAV